MRKHLQLLIACLTLVSAAAPCRAQAEDTSEAKFFRLDFTVKELESGKLINSRNYSMILSNDKRMPSSSIRSGEKVPYMRPDGSQSYAEFGVNIDCREPREVASQLSMYVIVDISGAGLNDKPTAAPLIRNTKWSGTVLVPFRKATTLFSSDDSSSKRQMQLELTATPIKL